MKYSLPNLISLLRVIIAPIFFVLLISGKPELIQLSCILYLTGATTDYVDGWFARKYGEITSWGKFFDPLADKVLTTFAFIAFVILKIIPLWMVLIIIVRDFGTTFLRAYADKIDKSVITSRLAKWKTFIQMLFIAYILMLLLIKSLDMFVESRLLINSIIYSEYTYIMMFLLTVLTIWSGIEYIFQNKSVISDIWSSFIKKTVL